MTKQEQLGVPPTEVMRQLLGENPALVRLLAADAINHKVNGTGPEPCAETDAANALIVTYREVLELLEIMRATSDRSTTANSRWSDSDEETGGSVEPSENSQLKSTNNPLDGRKDDLGDE